MPAYQIMLIGGSLQDAEGNFLSNGTLRLVLNQDAQVNGNTQICAGETIEVQLDPNGNVVSAPEVFIWPNDVMSPSNCYYTVTGYGADGNLCWGPNTQQILTGSPPLGTFDVGTWVPNQLAYWTPNPQPVLFETNGVPNQSQVLQNIIAGEDITITNEGGNVTFAVNTPSLAPYDVPYAVRGTPPASETMYIRVFSSSVQFPAGLVGSTGHVGSPPEFNSTWVLNHNDVTFGNFVIGTSGEFTFNSASAQTFNSSDWLSVTLPSSDPTLNTVLFDLLGNYE